MSTISAELLLKTINNMEQIAVYIPDEEAAKFLLFQEHFEPFSIMLDANLFTIRNGSATLHFDSSGTLQAINRSDVLYSRRHQL